MSRRFSQFRSPTRSPARLLLCVALAVVIPRPLWTQAVTTASVRGQIRAANGDEINDARVRLTNDATGFSVTSPESAFQLQLALRYSF